MKSVFSVKKKKKKETKLNKNKTKQKKGSFTLHSALTSLVQEQAESVHVFIFKLHIASCCYIYSCLMTPSQVWRLKPPKHKHTHTPLFFQFSLAMARISQWQEARG